MVTFKRHLLTRNLQGKSAEKIFGRFFFVYADQLQMLHNEVVFADMLIEKPRKPVLRTYQSILIFRMEIFAEKILVCYVKWTSQGH